LGEKEGLAVVRVRGYTRIEGFARNASVLQF
jgi:hypothetical protein